MITKQAIPDLDLPVVIPPPELSSVTLMPSMLGEPGIWLNTDDARKLVKHREKQKAEVEKGIEGMKAYRKLLEKWAERF